MSVRTRLIYSKRGAACFVPHIALAQIFSRSASRAGLQLVMTQGFSPRAKLSFGPELPAGVVALNEPVDMYFADSSPDIISLMNNALPEGFKVSQALFPPEDSPSLGKSCKNAEYLLKTQNLPQLENTARNFYSHSVKHCAIDDGWLRLILNDPAQNPIGGLVKFMIANNSLNGWHEINIVRSAIGIYDSQKGCVVLNA